MEAAPDFDQSDNIIPFDLADDEQRIARAVVAALSPRLKRIEETVVSNGKRLGVLEQEMRGVNKIFAANGFIIPDAD